MWWHVKHAQTPGEMRHPTDSELGKFSTSIPYLLLNQEILGWHLARKDFSIRSKWFRILIMACNLSTYNLPSWMCINDPYMHLTVTVPSLKNPKQKTKLPVACNTDVDYQRHPHIFNVIKMENVCQHACP